MNSSKPVTKPEKDLHEKSPITKQKNQTLKGGKKKKRKQKSPITKQKKQTLNGGKKKKRKQSKPKENDDRQLLSLQKENASLKTKARTLEHGLQSARKLHHSTKRKLEGELLDLKEKLRDTEAEYSKLAATPPKTRTVRVVSEETKKQLDQMITQNKELEDLLAKSRSDYNAKVSALQAIIKSLKTNITEITKNEHKALADCRTLQEAVKEMRSLESVLKQMESKMKTLENEKNPELEPNRESKTEPETSSKQHPLTAELIAVKLDFLRSDWPEKVFVFE